MAKSESKNETKTKKSEAKPVEETKPETTGPIPGKTEDHAPVIAGEPGELGNESVPGGDPDQPGMGFEVIPNKSEDHAPVMAGEPKELGAEAVPGSEAPGTPKSSWDVIPGKTESHEPVINGEPAELGAGSVPSNPRNEPQDATDVADEDSDARSTGKREKLRLKGYKGREAARIPAAVTLIMPDKDGEKQAENKQAVTSGRTLVVRRDEYLEFTAKEAKWLNGHERYEFEKA